MEFNNFMNNFNFRDGDYGFYLSRDKDGHVYAGIDDYFGNSKNIIIPSSYTRQGINYNVEELIDCFINRHFVESVVLPNTIKSIGKEGFVFGTFQNCKNLKNITLPFGLEFIGPETFSGCESLTSVTIPDSITKIGENAFDGCTNLSSVTLPKSWESKSKEELNHDLKNIGIDSSQLKVIKFGSQNQGQNLSMRDVNVNRSMGEFNIIACDLGGKRPETPALYVQPSKSKKCP